MHRFQPTPFRRTGAIVASVVVALVAAGCGSTTPRGTSGNSVATLLRHVPLGVNIIVTADLVAARSRLGLASDADLLPAQGATPQARLLLSAAGAAFPDLEVPYVPAVASALDQAKVTAMVSSADHGGVTLIATSQSENSLRARLLAEHFRRVGGAWVGPPVEHGLVQPEVVSLFAGGLAVGRTPSAVTAAASRHTAPSADRPDLAAIRGLDGFPSAIAITYPRGCVASIGIGDRLSPRTGVLRIVPSGAPRLAEFHSGPISPGSDHVPVAGPARLDGSAIVAPLSIGPSGSAVAMVSFLVEVALDHRFYPC